MLPKNYDENYWLLKLEEIFFKKLVYFGIDQWEKALIETFNLFFFGKRDTSGEIPLFVIKRTDRIEIDHMYNICEGLLDSKIFNPDLKRANRITKVIYEWFRGESPKNYPKRWLNLAKYELKTSKNTYYFLNNSSMVSEINIIVEKFIDTLENMGVV